MKHQQTGQSIWATSNTTTNTSSCPFQLPILTVTHIVGPKGQIACGKNTRTRTPPIEWVQPTGQQSTACELVRHKQTTAPIGSIGYNHRHLMARSRIRHSLLYVLLYAFSFTSSHRTSFLPVQMLSIRLDEVPIACHRRVSLWAS